MCPILVTTSLKQEVVHNHEGLANNSATERRSKKDLTVL